MKITNLCFLIFALSFHHAHAFGPSAEEKKKMKEHLSLCEKHLKNACGEDLEFPDMDKGSPGPGMFKKMMKIKKCIKSDAVQNSNIPEECKKDIGPGSR